MFVKNSTTKWLYKVPYLMKYCEEQPTEKWMGVYTGYKMRLLHPVGIVVYLLWLLVFLLFSIVYGGLIQFWQEGIIGTKGDVTLF